MEASIYRPGQRWYQTWLSVLMFSLNDLNLLSKIIQLSFKLRGLKIIVPSYFIRGIKSLFKDKGTTGVSPSSQQVRSNDRNSFKATISKKYFVLAAIKNSKTSNIKSF